MCEAISDIVKLRKITNGYMHYSLHNYGLSHVTIAIANITSFVGPA